MGTICRIFGHECQPPLGEVRTRLGTGYFVETAMVNMSDGLRNNFMSFNFLQSYCVCIIYSQAYVWVQIYIQEETKLSLILSWLTEALMVRGYLTVVVLRNNVWVHVFQSKNPQWLIRPCFPRKSCWLVWTSWWICRHWSRHGNAHNHHLPPTAYKMREGRNLVTIVVHLRSMSCVLCAPARHVQEWRELYLFPQGWSRCHRHHEMDREATVERWPDFFYWCQVIPPSRGVGKNPRVH